MRCIVTAGPTFEPLDAVRRLTNFSTGRLGCELANFLSDRGHETTLLLGQPATYPGPQRARQITTFTTTADLRARLQALAARPVDALFHAAAVSDFGFGKVWHRSAQGEMTELKAGKFGTRQGALLAELVPTPKIIAELRQWFPGARIVGWKYEVDGTREAAVRLARRQLAECRTDACVANGPAYGPGFGLVTADGPAAHFATRPALFAALESYCAPMEDGR
ncbi:MAG TPA: phosphopantothenoylcysteine decarboxylase [Candidatus Acidoferrum sp.]|nr:phosphopantothenoylcysteine decarboxylase [Candidatus Acidoferrum sp.]